MEDGKLRGGAIVAKYRHAKNKSLLYIPEGPVVPYDKPEGARMFDMIMGAVDTIAEFDGDKPTSHLTIEPKLTAVPSFFSRLRKAPFERQPLRTLVMDLGLSEDKLLAQMKPKGRYNIRIAQKNGVEVARVAPGDGSDAFLDLYLPMVARNKFEGKDRDYFERLFYALAEYRSGDVFLARHGGRILAAAIITYFGDTATFLFGASSDEDKNIMAPYALHWEIMRHAKREGYRWYDWYGISPSENTPHPWDGFSAFKNKFGGQQIRYAGAYDFVYNEKLYKEYLRENES